MNENDNNTQSIFENNNVDQINIETEVKEEKINEQVSQENVVKPISYEKDLGDKTIDAVETFINTEDHKGEFSLEEVNKNRTNAIISYIPLVSLYFIVTAKFKESNYLKFHVNQGLITTIVWILSFFISKTLSAIFTRESLLLNNTPGWVSFISYVLYCLSFALTLFGIINTVNDSSKEFPIIGKIKLLK